MTKYGTFLTVLLLLAVLAPVLAQGDLYGPEAPADVAWIRVINAVPGEPVDALLADTELEIAFAEGSDYVAVAPGEHDFQVGGHQVQLSVEPESFTSIAVLESGPLPVPETGLRDISRGLLGLMNLTDRATLTLLTAAGEVVIQDVAPGQASSLAISPASTGLDVSDGDTVLATVDERSFDLAEAYTVVVMETADGPVAVLLQAGSN